MVTTQIWELFQMFSVERPGAEATRFLDGYYSNMDIVSDVQCGEARG
jgi:hypothetical protein